MLPEPDCRAYFNSLALSWDGRCAPCPELLSTVAFLCGAKPGLRVLDIACGTGVMFPALLSQGVESLVGVDVSDGMAAIASSKFLDEARVEVLCQDFHALECSPFHAALLYNAYPHFVNKEALLAKAASLLLPGGRFTVAHGMGREALNAHHGNVPTAVSTPLGPACGEARLWAPWFNVDMCCDSAGFYLISGAKR